MFKETTATYGLSKELFVTRKSSGESIIIGGLGEGEARWVRVLSYRAAQLLWVHLTQLLFPERGVSMTAHLTTAPMRHAGQPVITTHVSLGALKNGRSTIVGWIGQNTWRVDLMPEEALHLWEMLDDALYPGGSMPKSLPN